MATEYIKFFEGWMDSIETIPDETQRQELALAILRYAFKGEKYQGNSPFVCVMMPTISKAIDATNFFRECGNNGYQKKLSKGATEGAIQGGIEGATKGARYNTNTNTNTNNNTKEKKKKVKDNILPIPSIEEVEEYIKSKGYDIDARAFWAYYDAREWMKDGKPIKNWHLQVATWVNNSNRYDKGKHKPIQINSMPRPAEPERDRNVPLLEGNIPGVDYEYIKRLREEQERKGKLKPKD